MELVQAVELLGFEPVRRPGDTIDLAHFFVGLPSALYGENGIAEPELTEKGARTDQTRNLRMVAVLEKPT